MINSRFEDLQRRCNSIYRKKLLQKLLIIFFAIFICTGSWYLYENLYKAKQQKILIKKQTVLRKKQIIIKPKKIQPIKRKTLILVPQINIQKLKVPKKAEIKKIKKELHQLSMTLKTQEIPKKKVESKIKFKINLINSNEETILLKNFRISKKYTIALKLSNYYLLNKDYKKAIFWAKNASRLDSTKAKPWIIYAKSKHALGEKKEAIDSLQTFLNYFYSKEANALLQKYLKKK